MKYRDMSTEELMKREVHLMLDLDICDNRVSMLEQIRMIVEELDKRCE